MNETEALRRIINDLLVDLRDHNMAATSWLAHMYDERLRKEGLK